MPLNLMHIRGTWADAPFALSHKPTHLTLSLGAPESAQVYSYDAAGRPWSLFMAGVAYRRGLDGRMLARWRDASGVRQRRWLDAPQAREQESRARAQLAAFVTALENVEALPTRPIPDAAHTNLARALAFDAQRAAEEVARYHQIYRPVGILPPDQYMAVVLQATEGCSFNTCTFCTFYKNVRFRVKTSAEYRAHVAAVRGLLGPGLSLRRALFLGDANALVVPMPHLMPLIEVTRAQFDVDALGLYAFLDGFSGEKKTVADYATLAGAGLRRVYIGLESGHAPLLTLLRKPGTPADAIQAVHALKAGGVAVGVIILLGAGGMAHDAGHVQDTVAVLNAMGLSRGDIVYFSELITTPGMPYAAEAAHLGALTHPERLAQGEAIRAGLHFASGDAPTLSRYDIRDFIY